MISTTRINEICSQLDTIAGELKKEQVPYELFRHVYGKTQEVSSAAIFRGLRDGHFDHNKPKGAAA